MTAPSSCRTSGRNDSGAVAANRRLLGRSAHSSTTGRPLVERQLRGLLDLSDTGSATAGGVAAALVLATSGFRASTGRAELGRGALAGVERGFSAHAGSPACCTAESCSVTKGGLGVLGLPCSGATRGGSTEGIAVALPRRSADIRGLPHSWDAHRGDRNAMPISVAPPTTSALHAAAWSPACIAVGLLCAEPP
jgi:hypothetical protein